MKKRIRFIEDHSMWLSILMVVIGLILALWPGHVMNTAVTIVGIAFLLGGVISLVSWYRGRMKGANYVALAEGILMLLAGIFVLSSRKLLISILPVCVGVLLIINGIINLAQALDLRREGYTRWPFSLALAVLTLVLGLLVAVNPFTTMEIVVMVIGVVIIYNGLSNLWIESRYRRL